MAAHDKRIEIRLVGKGVAPGLIRSKEIAEVITAVEGMIAAMVEHENPDIKADDVLIGLSAVTGGSMTLVFTPGMEALTVPAAETVMRAIDRQQFEGLPHGTLAGLRKLHSFTKQHELTTEFRTLNGASVLLAEMTSQTTIPTPTYLKGDTTVYGDILRVGGADPKVQFRSISDSELIYCDATRDMTRQVAMRLYERVGLRGQAVWDLETMKLESFRIEEILDYEDVGIVQAFAELRESVGGYFDEIDDVNTFVEHLRNAEQ